MEDPATSMEALCSELFKGFIDTFRDYVASVIFRTLTVHDWTLRSIFNDLYSSRTPSGPV
jgi:hypothetical protein